jgi:hypothetical protein
MSLSIDVNEDKVAELLKSSGNGYVVSTSDVPMVENCGPVYPSTSEVSGAVYSAPVLVTAGTRERLMSARRQIEESGAPLKSAEELAREIDEMRGRR